MYSGVSIHNTPHGPQIKTVLLKHSVKRGYELFNSRFASQNGEPPQKLDEPLILVLGPT
uniref:Uncharacterized protein n=1 Tax=Arion vulgaris TaxID=1028688 RepID=A0A0B7BE71_9EUPU